MKVLSTKETFYIARRTKGSDNGIVEPIYYNTDSRSYTPTMDYSYATTYATELEVKKRVSILNMLAALENLEEVTTEYFTVKRTETIEEVTGEI